MSVSSLDPPRECAVVTPVVGVRVHDADRLSDGKKVVDSAHAAEDGDVRLIALLLLQTALAGAPPCQDVVCVEVEKAGDAVTFYATSRADGVSIAITTERPALYALQGFIKHGPDPLTAVAEARKTRGRV